ncbi:MAG: hypothetical protein IAE91_14480 [Ignavibacteriaceae bacterium]|nr:hypothetical protein [Ignavibacteriaceae bacterium]
MEIEFSNGEFLTAEFVNGLLFDTDNEVNFVLGLSAAFPDSELGNVAKSNKAMLEEFVDSEVEVYLSFRGAVKFEVDFDPEDEHSCTLFGKILNVDSTKNHLTLLANIDEEEVELQINSLDYEYIYQLRDEN